MENHAEWSKGEFVISTDPTRLDREMILEFLATSYWAGWLERDVIAKSLDHCLPFGLYNGKGDQIGFARVITDFARFAWLGDVFVLEPYRGNGLATWLNETIKDHDLLKDVNRWVLATRDAHGLYAKLGYEVLPEPDKWMVWDHRRQDN